MRRWHTVRAPSARHEVRAQRLPCASIPSALADAPPLLLRPLDILPIHVARAPSCPQVLYKLSREQLSRQFHYDFGLRALKSVLVMAGGLKRQYAGMPEDLVLMRALRDSNMPKFIFEDVPLFVGLVGDLFPGMDCPRVGHEGLKVPRPLSPWRPPRLALFQQALAKHGAMALRATAAHPFSDYTPTSCTRL
jgi:Hydrolytic ATP binding site of dynein motor region